MTKIYRNLARNAMGKNKIIYVPYIISSMMMILITYIIAAISRDRYLRQVAGGATLQQIMIVGVPIMYVISFFFLFGVSRFVIKQRKKELGVYCVLGMQKKHIIRVQFLENLYTYLISAISGTVIGIVLEKAKRISVFWTVAWKANMSLSEEWSREKKHAVKDMARWSCRPRYC